MVCIQSILMQASNVSEVVECLTTDPKIDDSKSHGIIFIDEILLMGKAY
jgi:hypothetical protein